MLQHSEILDDLEGGEYKLEDNFFYHNIATEKGVQYVRTPVEKVPHTTDDVEKAFQSLRERFTTRY